MKIYLFPQAVTMVGKAWEIKAKLAEYSKQFETVQQWLESAEPRNDSLPSSTPLLPKNNIFEIVPPKKVK